MTDYQNEIYRFPKVNKITGLSRSTIKRLEQQGSFPKRVQISANAVGWRKSDVSAWLETRQTA